MEKEARFIIKEDKYSIIIIYLVDSNNKMKKGITIFKKTLEINELNEDNINMVLNKKEKLIFSFANLGLSEISGIKCFIYCSERDVKEVGIISFTKIYKILNLRYLILEDLDIDTTDRLKIFFREHAKSEVNKGLFFAQDKYNMDKSFDIFFHRLYEMNKNVCHINPKINFCYNYDNISYIEKFGFNDFTTHIICGYFMQNIVSTLKKEEFITNIIVKEKEIHEDHFVKNNDIKEFEIILCPNNNIFLNQIFHFIFYAFLGFYFDAKTVIYNILLKDQSPKRINNGAIIIVDIDNDLDKTYAQNYENIKKVIEEEMAKILGNNNKVLVIENKKDIGKIIKNNEKLFSEIKYNYEFKDTDCILEFQEKQLLIISDNYENILLIIENILYYLKYNFLDDNNELKPKIKTSIQEMLNSLKKFSKLKDSKLLKGMKFKIEAVNEEYLNMKRINIEKLKKNKQLELKEKNSKKEESTITNNNIKINEIKEEEKIKNAINDKINSENISSSQKLIEEKEKFNIYIVTFNTSNYDFLNTKEELTLLNDILFPKETIDLYKDKDPPTFFVIGLQEIVKLNTSNIIFDSNKSSSFLWESKITQLLLSNYNYTLQFRENMVGILLLIFVKSSEAKNIKNMRKSLIKAGFMNTLGNKGYIIYEFKYKNKTFSFGSGHLTAGENEKNYKNRTNLLINILNHKSDKNLRLFENDFYFLFGDMNFRVKVDKKDFFEEVEKIKNTNVAKRVSDDSYLIQIKPIQDIDEEVNKNLQLKKYKRRCSNSLNKYDINKIRSIQAFKKKEIKTTNDDFKLFLQRNLDEKKYKFYFFKEHLENDELNGFRSNLSTFNTKENKIRFLPTYKYIKGYNYYDLVKRVPAWTDRILYKNSDNVKCLKYNSINIKISDHKPVFGFFEINI
jgi:hypothetical protein